MAPTTTLIRSSTRISNAVDTNEQARQDVEQTENEGTSLAKWPVGLIGLAQVVYDITALMFGRHSFAQHAPNGAVHGKGWIGLDVIGAACCSSPPDCCCR